jgi:hypothetical protein
MPDERRQFRVLYRDFLSRLIDPDLLSAGGDARNLLVIFAALLAAFSFLLSVYRVPAYGLSTLPRRTLLVAAWGDQEFLIAFTMAVCGMFAVLAWNAVYPERRDALVLGPLALRGRTILRAKTAAIATALGLTIVAVNVFTGLSYPFVVIPPGAGAFGALRAMGAYWLTMLGAGMFPFCSLLALQGIASQLLPRGLFPRLSAFLQVAAFFAVLGVFLLTPPLATPVGLTRPENQRLLAFLPSLWFLGLFQELNGSLHPAFRALAVRAVLALSASSLVAGVTYGCGWTHHMRRVIEQPDIVPSGRQRASGRFMAHLVRIAAPRPLHRAIVLFTARTLARSRQHRLLMALYVGIGLALAVVYAKGLPAWRTVSVPLLAVSVVLLVFMVVGMRAAFSLPIALASNWIFRVTAVHRPAAYFSAVRLALYAFAFAPVWIASGALYLALWPGRPAAEHLLLLAAGGVFLIEWSMYRFRKIPFACSYLPGRSGLRMRMGAYAIGFLFIADVGMRLEAWTLEKTARFAALAGLLLIGALWSRRRTAEFARAAGLGVQFEELPPAETLVLNLGRETEWHDDSGIAEAQSEISLWGRLRLIVLGLSVLLLFGCVYEHIGQWNDRRSFPRQGRSFDIGGRSLNLACSGAGAPAVIFESDQGVAGCSWTAIQREVARFTRTCWYDRAGYGWSDPGPYPNHSDAAARDLHRLLHAARVPAPFVLVGHRFGSFHVRVFRGYWPREVAGLVLVDPLNEDTTIRVHNHIEALRPAVILLARTLGFFGWWRLIEDAPGPPPRGLTPQEWAAARAMVRQNKTVAARIGEPPMWISGELARRAGGFGDLPVVVLSPGTPASAWYTETFERKLQLHEALAGRSSRGMHVIANGAGGMLPFETPEAVVEAVHGVVAQARAQRDDGAGAPDRPEHSGDALHGGAL